MTTKTLLALAALDFAPAKKLGFDAFRTASTVKPRGFGTFLCKLEDDRLIAIDRPSEPFAHATVELTFGGMQYLRNHAK